MGTFKNKLWGLMVAAAIAMPCMADVVVRFNNCSDFTDQFTPSPAQTLLVPESIVVEIDGVVVPPPPEGRTGQILISYNYVDALHGYDTNISMGPDISIGLHTNYTLHPGFLIDRRPMFVGPVLDSGYFANQPIYFCTVQATRYVDNPLGIYVSPNHYCDLVLSFTESPFPEGDINLDGAFTLNDLYNMLHYYFLNRLEADFNRDGIISTQDIFDFLDLYYTI